MVAFSLHSQVTLQADGPGNTYQLLSSVLGGTPYEVPDCKHTAFGPHITETFDATLGKYVFVFHIHVSEDDDRCVNFDRQRNEIKTYGSSPTYTKGLYGDFCTYRWKFKLDAGFQPSPNFCHIHQIKAGDGSDSGSPLITITPRSGSPERLEIIFTAPSGLSGSGTKATANLSSFKGQWIEAYERTKYATNGTYELTLRRVSDGVVLLGYTNNNLNLWRGDATFNRPKWGIYRSLNSTNYLRDEQVLFADFCIAKGNDSCPSDIGTQPRFSLSAGPASALVLRGSGTNFTVSLATNTGFSGPVSFSLTGLPSNTSANFSPASLSSAGAVQLTLATSNNAPLGTFPLTITGKASNFTNTTSATLIITTNIPASPGALVARLTFDEGTADDSSGYDNHGTLVNGATIVADPQRGWVASFDGVNDYVDLGNDSSLELSLTGQATVAAWLKLAVSHNHNTILSKGEWQEAYALLIKGDTTPGDQLWTGNDTSVFSGSAVPTNIWTHVAVTISNDLATFYMNGQLAGAPSQDRGNAIDTTTNNFCLGREQYPGALPAGRWFFNGQMDDVRLYAKSLTAAEIQNMFLNTTPQPPLITGWALDGSNLVLSAGLGLPGATCYVLTSSNLSLPLANWARGSTNQFGPGGEFQVTNSFDPLSPQSFHVLQLR
jgi:Concanavalin A-like lectin/glucanases superfamily